MRTPETRSRAANRPDDRQRVDLHRSLPLVRARRALCVFGIQHHESVRRNYAMSASSRSIEHVGEWHVAFEADTLEELFAEVANVIAQSTGRTEAKRGPWERIGLRGRDVPTLLVDWANELLGRSEVECRAYSELRDLVVRTGEHGAEVTAQVRGRNVGVWSSPLKAATYHALNAAPRGGGWQAVILFDI
jgi:SHS2 domain-containing protein